MIFLFDSYLLPFNITLNKCILKKTVFQYY